MIQLLKISARTQRGRSRCQRNRNFTSGRYFLNTFVTSKFSNQYGVVKKRLTINDVFDGEAAIAPNGKTVVYSSFNGTDYELFRMNLDETGTPPIKVSRDCQRILLSLQITNKYGFEGGVSFSADGKLIAYYASRPRTRTEIANYKVGTRRSTRNDHSLQLGIEYGFTDIGKTEISIYSFESEKEYVVYPAKETSHSPVFTGPDRMVFVTGVDS